MSDLAAFLVARLNEDEAAAWASKDSPWLVGHTMACDWWGDVPGFCTCDAAARVLADVQAKRAIMAEHSVAEYDVDGKPVCKTCVSPDDWNVTKMPDGLIYPCPTLRHLATVYASHPDYDEAWRP